MGLVSVIIPCYNQGSYLEECLQSVKSQSYKNFEIVVINDGSDDVSTLKNLAEMKKRYPEILFIDINNSGVSKARNIAIDHCKGKYILPLDADDKISPKYIERCIEVFQTKPVDIVYCLGGFFGEKSGLWYLPPYSKKKILKNNMVFVTAMYKKEDYLLCNGYNPNMKHGLEDWDFWLSMTELNKVFYRIDEIHFYYRIKTKSRTSNMNEEKKFRETLLQLQSNHPALYKNYSIPLEDNRSFFEKAYGRIKFTINKKFFELKLKKQGEL